MDEASAVPMVKVETSQNAEADYAHAETSVLVHTPPPEEVSDCKNYGKCISINTRP